MSALRGFALMDKEKRKEIATKGGRAAQELGVGHRLTSEDASRGGKEAQKRGTAHRFNHAEAVVAGKKGGDAKAASRHDGLLPEKDFETEVP